MCGIAGIFFKNEINNVEGKLSHILSRIKHRGHSLFETALGDGWTMGANRLEIVDPYSGRQPIYSSDKQVATVFNGEIYNFLELKALLSEKGYCFITGTDTEVIANGYHCWGTNVFNKLDGMFAIIIWDNRTKEYIAARDPIGVKPLYYCNPGNQTVFASEIKALIDYSDDIETIKPGHFLKDGSNQTRYYRGEQPQIGDNLIQNSVILRELISASVKKRVQSDLPIAIFLSGGIDSSIILYEAIKHHPNVTAFSIGSQDAQDVKIGRRLCLKLNVPFIHIPIDSATLLQSIPDVVWSIESFEPNHIRGGTLSFFLSKEVAGRGFKIALCGEGADELFGGYREFGIALEAGESEDAISNLFERFVTELHRTQLQRVDRTSMNFTLEVREPYLDKRILDFSYSLPITQKIGISSEGKWLNKLTLREAYRGILPNWITSREKVVLSLGAGFGSNGPEGIFYENGLRMVSAQELHNLQTRYPEYKINTSEEAYYFKIFLEKFGEIDIVKNRPLVNATLVKT